MKNVTPATGRVWTRNDTGKKFTCLIETKWGWLFELQDGDKSNVGAIPTWELDRFFTFEPQNDLEWLAVNCDKWINERGFGFISRNKPQRADQWNDFGFTVGSGVSGYYTREQWQNMRYDLGLDEKPMSIKEYIFDEIKKETKMIDLSNAKVGDEFVDENKNIVEIMIADNDAGRYIGKGAGVNGGKVFYSVYTGIGNNLNSRCCDLLSKHDPRTDEEKAVGAMFVEMSTKMQLRGDHDDYMVNDDTQVGVEFVIEYMTANGFKWVGE